jgi:hypothetical protein
MPAHPAEFSGSDEDVDEEELDPEEEDGDVMGDEMVAMEGEEDPEDEDGLGKSFLSTCPGFIVCHVTRTSHVRPLNWDCLEAYTTVLPASPSSVQLTCT